MAKTPTIDFKVSPYTFRVGGFTLGFAVFQYANTRKKGKKFIRPVVVKS